MFSELDFTARLYLCGHRAQHGRLRVGSCPPTRITRGRGDWLGLTSCDSFHSLPSSGLCRRTLTPFPPGRNRGTVGRPFHNTETFGRNRGTVRRPFHNTETFGRNRGTVRRPFHNTETFGRNRGTVRRPFHNTETFGRTAERSGDHSTTRRPSVETAERWETIPQHGDLRSEPWNGRETIPQRGDLRSEPRNGREAVPQHGRQHGGRMVSLHIAIISPPPPSPHVSASPPRRPAKASLGPRPVRRRARGTSREEENGSRRGRW